MERCLACPREFNQPALENDSPYSALDRRDGGGVRSCSVADLVVLAVAEWHCAPDVEMVLGDGALEGAVDVLDRASWVNLELRAEVVEHRRHRPHGVSSARHEQEAHRHR